MPYSRKGSWALWIRAASRNLAFALGHEGSGRVNPRSSPRTAAQGWCVSTRLRGRDSVQIFITRSGLVPPVCPETLCVKPFPRTLTGLQNSQRRAQKRPGLVSFPEPFPKGKVCLVGANSFRAGAPRNRCQVNSREPHPNTVWKRKACTDTSVWILSANLLPPSSLSLCAPLAGRHCVSRDPSFLLKIPRDFLILLPSLRTPPRGNRSSSPGPRVLICTWDRPRRLCASESTTMNHTQRRAPALACIRTRWRFIFPSGQELSPRGQPAWGETSALSLTNCMPSIGQLLPVKKRALLFPHP